MGNIIPATTGAAQAVVKVLPELKGKFHGESPERCINCIKSSMEHGTRLLTIRHLRPRPCHERLPRRPDSPPRAPRLIQRGAHGAIPSRGRQANLPTNDQG